MTVKELIDYLNKNFHEDDLVIVLAKHSHELISTTINVDKVAFGKVDYPAVIIYDGRNSG